MLHVERVLLISHRVDPVEVVEVLDDCGGVVAAISTSIHRTELRLGVRLDSVDCTLLVLLVADLCPMLVAWLRVLIQVDLNPVHRIRLLIYALAEPRMLLLALLESRLRGRLLMTVT